MPLFGKEPTKYPVVANLRKKKRNLQLKRPFLVLISKWFLQYSKEKRRIPPIERKEVSRASLQRRVGILGFSSP